jgi:DNA gyrase subunit A
MGRQAGGVGAIRFIENDEIAGMDVINDPEATLLVVTEFGFGKRTKLHEYRLQQRYGYGIRTLSSKSLEEKTGRIIGASVVSPDDDLTLITVGGMALRTEVGMINVYKRATSGVKIIHLAKEDVIVSMAIVSGDLEERQRRAALESGNGADEPVLGEDEDEVEIGADDEEAILEGEIPEDAEFEEDFGDEPEDDPDDFGGTRESSGSEDDER